MKILILGGFLGSGKTTLLLRIAEYLSKRSTSETPVAILENEIGSIGIDDQLMADKGYSVTNMLSGCACCTLSGELLQAVLNIQQDINPDMLVIESTGLAVPSAMKDTIGRLLALDIRICVLVDASRWRKMRIPLETLLLQQLQGADVICVTKGDLVDVDELSFVERTVREINAVAPLVKAAASQELSDDTISMIAG